ncbi:hypothetical protein [Dethiobacter alkaliphilus]|uniref:hypothetical protein n=1 Tax=Dethiobacter alkaliphilus TaxID=427926 RepID=UPI0022278C7B|nr:hypothetical protein [Dethiobacter alkaliphilus]MCW3490918.1 hypothetical protein [Dethiobacter alkaliphilus]
MTIHFRRERISADLLDPRIGFARTTHDNMEFRYDPLTGRSTRLAHIGAIRPQKLHYDDYNGENKGYCPFCPPQMEQATSIFPKELIPEGRLVRGDTTLIANIAPYDTYSGLVVLSEKHVLTIEDMTVNLLRDAFGLAAEFMERVKKHDPLIPYYFMGWNYMPPSGGGLVHAHIQVFGSRDPGNVFFSDLHALSRYKKETGHHFWPDYLAEEQKRGERYLAQIGELHWFVPFAPLGFMGDVMAILPRPCTPAHFREELLDDFVAGLSRLFTFYKDKGVYSFNASIHFSPDRNSEYPLVVRFSPRTFLNKKYYPPDANFFHIMLQQPVCVVWPEETAELIRPYFTA